MTEEEQKEWHQLYLEDPEAFEKHRKEFIENQIKIIANGDEQKEWKLKGLQLSIDKVRKKYKDPIACASKMNALMMDSFYDLNDMWNGLNSTVKRNNSDE